MATSTETRKDYGTHIPGARKRDNETTLKVLEDLTTMSHSTASYPNDLVVAKLIEIRRDDIWGSLGSRLAELQENSVNQKRGVVRGIRVGKESGIVAGIESRKERLDFRGSTSKRVAKNFLAFDSSIFTHSHKDQPVEQTLNNVVKHGLGDQRVTFNDVLTNLHAPSVELLDKRGVSGHRLHWPMSGTELLLPVGVTNT